MQQAIYNNISSVRIQSRTNKTANTGASPAGVLRWVSRKWDLAGVVALMGASAAYGVFELAHLGL